MNSIPAAIVTVSVVMTAGAAIIVDKDQCPRCLTPQSKGLKCNRLRLPLSPLSCISRLTVFAFVFRLPAAAVFRLSTGNDTGFLYFAFLFFCFIIFKF